MHTAESDIIKINKPPGTISSDIHWAFKEYGEYKIPEQYIISLKGGRVVGSNCYIVSNDDFVIIDLSREFGKNNDPAKMSIFKEYKLPTIKYYNGLVGVVGYTIPENYFHWLINVIPRVIMLQSFGYLESCEKIVVNNLKYSYQQESLAVLNFPFHKIITSDQKLHLKADTLVVPSIPHYDDNIPFWIIENLRKLFLNPTATSAKHKIYISRKNAKNRKVINEENVYESLKLKGFIFIELEGKTIFEQASIFFNAAIIVAPHGASQTNIIFCNPGTILIELFPAYWANHIYWSLCNQLDMDYYYLNDGNKQERSEEFKHYKVVNFEVSEHDLHAIIDMSIQGGLYKNKHSAIQN